MRLAHWSDTYPALLVAAGFQVRGCAAQYDEEAGAQTGAAGTNHIWQWREYTMDVDGQR